MARLPGASWIPFLLILDLSFAFSVSYSSMVMSNVQRRVYSLSYLYNNSKSCEQDASIPFSKLQIHEYKGKHFDDAALLKTFNSYFAFN